MPTTPTLPPSRVPHLRDSYIVARRGIREANRSLTRQLKAKGLMRTLHTHADLAGAATSTLCLLHCLLTPVLLSLFPGVLHWLPGDASIHRILAIAILLCGVAGFLPGYRLHRRKPLLALIATGITLILIVAWGGETMPEAIELACSLAGSLLLVAAHLLNRSFCRQCRTCTESPAPCHTTHFEGF